MFHYGPARVLKLYREGCPEAVARTEYENTLCVHRLGLPGPQVFEVVPVQKTAVSGRALPISLRSLPSSLKELFPVHVLIGDLMSGVFFQKYVQAFKQTVAAMGAPSRYCVEEREAVFSEAGYRAAEDVDRKHSEYAVANMYRIAVRGVRAESLASITVSPATRYGA